MVGGGSRTTDAAPSSFGDLSYVMLPPTCDRQVKHPACIIQPQPCQTGGLARLYDRLRELSTSSPPMQGMGQAGGHHDGSQARHHALDHNPRAGLDMQTGRTLNFRIVGSGFHISGALVRLGSVSDRFDISLARAHKLRHQLQQTRCPRGIDLIAKGNSMGS